MKANRIYVIVLGLMAITWFATTALGEERYRNHEMADGHFVRFKMTPQEIAAEAAEQAQRLALRQTATRKPRQWVEIIELPESGQQLVYPMSTEEIAAAKRQAVAEARQRQSVLLSNQEETDGGITTIEMADGRTITFRSDDRQTDADAGSWITRLIKRITT